MPKNNHAIFFQNALIAASIFKNEARAFVDVVADGLKKMKGRLVDLPSGIRCPECPSEPKVYLDEQFLCSKCGFKLNPPLEKRHGFPI